ncbi:hypothetical protein [Sphingobium sp. CFD-2]|nr:hypothetical protein [Sphingobium sp. CFD-2]
MIEHSILQMHDFARFGGVRYLQEELAAVGGGHPEVAIPFSTQFNGMERLAEDVSRQVFCILRAELGRLGGKRRIE